jgi:hypothetical protein
MLTYNLEGENWNTPPNDRTLDLLTASPAARKMLYLLRKLSQTMNWPLCWTFRAEGAEYAQELSLYIELRLHYRWDDTAITVGVVMPGINAISDEELVDRLSSLVRSTLERGIAVKEEHPRVSELPYMISLYRLVQELRYSSEALAGIFYGRCTAVISVRGRKMDQAKVDISLSVVPGQTTRLLTVTHRLYPGADMLMDLRSMILVAIRDKLTEWLFNYEDRTTSHITEAPIERGPAFRSVVERQRREADYRRRAEERQEEEEVDVDDDEA